jgi:hypothetical protein
MKRAEGGSFTPAIYLAARRANVPANAKNNLQTHQPHRSLNTLAPALAFFTLSKRVWGQLFQHQFIFKGLPLFIFRPILCVVAPDLR